MINPLMLLHHLNIAAFCSTTNAAGTVWDFPYTGAVLTITLGKGTYKLEVWGAEGGYRSSQSYSGKGGYSVGTITLTDKATTLYVYSGGSGRSGVLSGSVYSGGFNGGGHRYGYYGGGGGSDIRVGTDSLYARVIVAGGGGSDGAASKNGMYGGGTTGGSSTQSYGTGGYGGTQTGNTWITTTQYAGTTAQVNAYAGFGFGGNGVYRSSGYAGAGGGGWYGGSGSYPDSSGDDDRGGGGGSGYIYTSSTASNYPSGCLLTSKYYLTNASMKAGNTAFTSPTGTSETGHYGNGYCRITCIEGKGATKPEFVEYIESTGCLYIDTGFKPNQDTRVVIECGGCSASGWLEIFGAGSSVTNPSSNFLIVSNIANGALMQYGSELETIPITNLRDVFDSNKNNFYVNGVLSKTFTYTPFTSPYTLRIFDANTSVQDYPNYSGKIYSCKIYDNSTLVRDYIPARQNGIFGLWDKVEKKFYGSASTVNFVGPRSVILPSGYTLLNYIESTGLLYIDTLFKPTTKSKVCYDFQLTNISVGQYSGLYDLADAYLLFGSSNNIEVYLGSTYNASITKNTNRKNITFDIPNSSVFVDGVKVWISSYTNSNSTLPIFTIKRSTGFDSYMYMKLYSCQIYDDGVLVRDFIPCKNASDICGLYDVVNNVFYSSLSGTQFIGG